MKQHSDDYKLSAVMYYINHNEDLRDTCNIFKCKYQSLHRWIKRYKLQGNISRKTRKNHNLKITPEIERFIKEQVKRDPTTTLWEYSKLYGERKGGVKTTDILEFYDEFIKNNYKNYLIIMDNAVIHKSKLIKDKIENDSNKLLYSVAYHPETNSIEEFFSQLKHYIKRQSPNTYEDIDKVIKDTLKNKIHKEHLTNYLKHSYRIYK